MKETINNFLNLANIMPDNESLRKEAGLPEIAAGAGVGIAIAAGVPMIVHKMAYPSGIENVLTEQLEKRIAEKSNAISKPLLEEFKKIKPPPVEPLALVAWSEEAKTYARNSRAMQGLVKKETEIVSAKLLKSEQFNKASVWEKPLVAINSLSPAGQIALGAIIMISAVGAGYMVNQCRTSKETHVERLEKERFELKSRNPRGRD